MQKYSFIVWIVVFAGGIYALSALTAPPEGVPSTAVQSAQAPDENDPTEDGDFLLPLEQDRSAKKQRRASLRDDDSVANPSRKPDWTKAETWVRGIDPGKANPGLTLVPTSGSAEVALIENSGRLLHKWDVDAARARLLPNGNILVVHGSAWGERVRKWRRRMPFVTEYGWDGEIVWEHKTQTIAHHDLQRLPNGNTIYLTHHDVPDEVLAKVKDPLRKEKGVLADVIVEVNPQGEKVWEWKFYDHVDVNDCGPRACVTPNERGKLKAIRDWTHTNTLTIIPENKWYDQGDKRFKPGNLMILPRRFWTPFIIDYPSGEIVWRYTGEGYNGGFGAPHESSMIPKGLPGAGNVILVDNGMGTHPGETYIVEFDPVTMEVVWVYDKGEKFFNRTRGSVQRLANGNTLISYDRDGSILEVNPEGETVWEFPVGVELTRAHRYPPGYCERCDSLASSKG